MVNTKDAHKNWWSNNIVGIIVAALLAVLLGYQGIHQNQSYQDKQVQTQININVAKALEALNKDSDNDAEFKARLEAAVEDNEKRLDDHGNRISVIETKLN